MRFIAKRARRYSVLCAGRRRRTQAGSGDGAVVPHSEGVQRPFGNIAWQDQDKIGKIITEELPAMVAEDRAYQNAKVNSDRQNARIEHDRALESSFRATYDRVAGVGA